MTCPDIVALARRDEDDAIRRHAVTCPRCRRLVEVMDADTQVFRRSDGCARFDVMIAARLDGALAAADADALDAHLERCLQCATVVADGAS